MSNIFERFVALRYLRGKRKIGFISLITYISAAGVFLGSLVLVVALAIANGFEKEVRDRIVGTLAHAKILKYHSEPILDYQELEKKIVSHPDVEAAAPYISGKGAFEYDGVQEGVMIMGIDTEEEKKVTDISQKIIFGKFNLDSTLSNRGREHPGIIIGSEMADKMGLRPGTEVILMSVVEVDGQMEPLPVMMRFTVSGVFETGMYEYDLSLIYISVGSARILFNTQGVEGIKIKTSDMFRAQEIAQDVKLYIGGYPYRATDWQTQNKSLFQWMKLEKLVIFIVISMIIMVGAFNIISSLIMMILEKRREIGILMSMGATSSSIMKIFLLNGAIIGFVGSTAGVLSGCLLCYIQMRWQLIPLPGDIYFVKTLPVLIRPFDVAAIYIAANFLCIAASAYPALHASKILPAESIRYE